MVEPGLAVGPDRDERQPSGFDQGGILDRLDYDLAGQADDVIGGEEPRLGGLGLGQQAERAAAGGP